MSNVVIRVKNLSKEYRLGKIGYGTLYQDLQTGWAHLLGKEDPNAKISEPVTWRGNAVTERFWALKDISFDVFEGETVGIIGRNGAGKSTLLKIISRVTAPTGGEIKIKGRVASLLEVGTGFHPELSGRENVFLNGTILGMRKAEIEQKFDEIVKFAEIEKFIDTPVKRYSSGMYVRLAFAVAAHLEPEILIVDEVLAVGDARFQKKCLGKMGEVAHEGRTVLFVSHNMKSIEELCSYGILLNNGTILERGESGEVVTRYLSLVSELITVPLSERNDRTGSGQVRFTGVRLYADGIQCDNVRWGQDVVFEITYAALEPINPKHVRFAVSVSAANDVKIISFDSSIHNFSVQRLERTGVLRCHVPDFPLINGHYRGLLYGEIDNQIADRIPDAFEFDVISGKYPNVGHLSIEHEWVQI